MRPDLLVLAAAAALSACAAGDARPPAIAYGEVNCDFCHMTIEREQHAAQLVLARGGPKRFDEAGCLLHYAAMARLPADARLWVHDEASGAWTDARTAWYVVPARPAPGMMYGVLAYADRAHAEAARGDGAVTDYATLVATFGT